MTRSSAKDRYYAIGFSPLTNDNSQKNMYINCRSPGRRGLTLSSKSGVLDRSRGILFGEGFGSTTAPVVYVAYYNLTDRQFPITASAAMFIGKQIVADISFALENRR